MSVPLSQLFCLLHTPVRGSRWRLCSTPRAALSGRYILVHLVGCHTNARIGLPQVGYAQACYTKYKPSLLRDRILSGARSYCARAYFAKIPVDHWELLIECHFGKHQNCSFFGFQRGIHPSFFLQRGCLFLPCWLSVQDSAKEVVISPQNRTENAAMCMGNTLLNVMSNPCIYYCLAKKANSSCY
ncbi:MAG: hypothetical protein ACI9Y1_003613 [Lentisphaeria bacterium]|jgi:hypothetical protein